MTDEHDTPADQSAPSAIPLTPETVQVLRAVGVPLDESKLTTAAAEPAEPEPAFAVTPRDGMALDWLLRLYDQPQPGIPDADRLAALEQLQKVDAHRAAHKITSPSRPASA